MMHRIVGCTVQSQSLARVFLGPTRSCVQTCSRQTWASQIRRAFRNLVTRAHPDKGGDAEQFRLIQQAYEVLSDPAKVGDSLGRRASLGW